MKIDKQAKIDIYYLIFFWAVNETIKGDKYPFAVPISRYIEIAAIASHWVAFFVGSVPFFRFTHNSWIIFFDGITKISVEWCSVAMHFPIGRYGNIFPSRNIKICFVEIHGTLIWSWYPVKFPVLIEATALRRSMAVSLHGFLHTAIRHQSCMMRLFIYPKAFRILNFRGH